jgi:Flp pilus assembly protein TadB
MKLPYPNTAVLAGIMVVAASVALLGGKPVSAIAILAVGGILVVQRRRLDRKRIENARLEKTVATFSDPST